LVGTRRPYGRGDAIWRRDTGTHRLSLWWSSELSAAQPLGQKQSTSSSAGSATWH
jgi:hypothetical protein